MKKSFLIVLFVLVFASAALAQQTQATPASAPQANPADVASIDAIIKAVYDVISGDAGQQRDWDRMRSLFHRDARLIPSGKNPNTGVVGARAMTPDDYIKRNEPFFAKEGFYEREVARRTEIFGNIAHVFSTYETFRKKDEKTPFMRGINSIQLLNDGKRWWIMTIYWQAETPETQLPKKYLKTRKD
ncbi:MAG: hypothetical protein M3384_13975 [Acidobacteriota bacterium]|nr:hypothetical protein [Acidobacteriota bacterium]